MNHSVMSCGIQNHEQRARKGRDSDAGSYRLATPQRCTALCKYSFSVDKARRGHQAGMAGFKVPLRRRKLRSEGAGVALIGTSHSLKPYSGDNRRNDQRSHDGFIELAQKSIVCPQNVVLIVVTQVVFLPTPFILPFRLRIEEQPSNLLISRSPSPQRRSRTAAIPPGWIRTSCEQQLHGRFMVEYRGPVQRVV